jgi:hypothetical protein
MCDYSLYHFPNRLASDGETLVVQRFSSGCIGLASACDLPATAPVNASVWQTLKSWFVPRLRRESVAVCMPHGSRLVLSSIPVKTRRQWGLLENEEVTFVQRSGGEFTYRDGVRLRSGVELSLQSVPPGVRVQVLSTSGSEEQPVRDDLAARELAWLASHVTSR